LSRECLIKGSKARSKGKGRRCWRR